MTQDYFFDLPATKGFQGGREQYLITVPMKILRRLLALDDGSDVMERSQRELNRTRARKISRYVADALDANTPYFLPALCGNINAELEFIPSPDNKKIGILRIPMDSDVKLFDGQTRSFGIMDMLRNRELESNDTIALVLTVNLDLSTRQQFFSDVNDNASKPPAAISMAYNGANAVNQLAMHVSRNIPELGVFVDYEHNVVPASSPLLVSFKAFTDATRKMLSLRQKDKVTDDQQRDAVILWAAWSRRLQWAEMLQDEAIIEYRKTNIGLHGVIVNALGMATGEMLESNSVEQVAAMISNARISLYDDFSHSLWHNVCVDAGTGAVQSNSRAQLLAAAKIMDIFQPVISDEPASEALDELWFVDVLPSSIEPSRYSKLSGDLQKVMNEFQLEPVMVRQAISQLPTASTGDEDFTFKALTNIRCMRQWLKAAF